MYSQQLTERWQHSLARSWQHFLRHCRSEPAAGDGPGSSPRCPHRPQACPAAHQGAGGKRGQLADGRHDLSERSHAVCALRQAQQSGNTLHEGSPAPSAASRSTPTPARSVRRGPHHHAGRRPVPANRDGLPRSAKPQADVVIGRSSPTRNCGAFIGQHCAALSHGDRTPNTLRGAGPFADDDVPLSASSDGETSCTNMHKWVHKRRISRYRKS